MTMLKICKNMTLAIERDVKTPTLLSEIALRTANKPQQAWPVKQQIDTLEQRVGQEPLHKEIMDFLKPPEALADQPNINILIWQETVHTGLEQSPEK